MIGKNKFQLLIILVYTQFFIHLIYVKIEYFISEQYIILK